MKRIVRDCEDFLIEKCCSLAACGRHAAPRVQRRRPSVGLRIVPLPLLSSERPIDLA